MSLYGQSVIQTLYTLTGVENPTMQPALQRQVEHRSGTLSRRGFLGVVGTAGAGMVFDPLTQLWTPAAVEGGTLIVEAGTGGAVARVSAALMPAAQAFARFLDESWDAKRPIEATWGGDGSSRARAGRNIRWNYRGGLPRLSDAITSGAVGRFSDHVIRYSEWAKGSAPLYFNEHVPLPVMAFETDPTVLVADCLAPRSRQLARVVDDGHLITFEVPGVYNRGRRSRR